MGSLVSTLAWHFVGDTLRDGRPVPADGAVLRHDGPVEICQSGLHASPRLIDALHYAPGSTICRDECRDVVVAQADKLVCRERVILWRVENADDLLLDFARRCALDVIHLWGAPDVVVRYLRTGDESLRAAASAAARAAARDAAWAAASAAARGAARGAARAAARDAAWGAAWAAARAAEWGAARAAANRRLTAMVSARRAEPTP